MSKDKYLIKILDVENAKNQSLSIDFEDSIEDINSKSPIKAELVLTSIGDYIEVKGSAKGIVILECDLCLDEFEHEFSFEIDELFTKTALLEAYGQETELKEGQFITDLKGNDNIDIYDLLYQSVILDLPNKKVCGINCKGDKFLSEENFINNTVDPRLEVFKNIQIKK